MHLKSPPGREGNWNLESRTIYKGEVLIICLSFKALS